MADSKPTPAEEYDTGPKLLKVETIDNFVCQAPEHREGKRYLLSGDLPFQTLSNAHFGLCLNPETTQEEAEALADAINKHCPAPFAQIFNRSLIED